MIQHSIRYVNFNHTFFQSKLYRTVVDDVIHNVREAFMDECVDEQVLSELKQVRVRHPKLMDKETAAKYRSLHVTVSL